MSVKIKVRYLLIRYIEIPFLYLKASVYRLAKN